LSNSDLLVLVARIFVFIVVAAPVGLAIPVVAAAMFVIVSVARVVDRGVVRRDRLFLVFVPLRPVVVVASAI
jgi:hypothetical protein